MLYYNNHAITKQLKWHEMYIASSTWHVLKCTIDYLLASI